MNHCGTCKYFGPELTGMDEDLDEQPSGFHACELIKHGNKGYMEFATPPQLGRAYVADGSGYFAALRVRSDFGCVEWEAKG